MNKLYIYCAECDFDDRYHEVTDLNVIEETLLEWVDMRVVEWTGSHPDMDGDELKRTALEHLFVIVDAALFPCEYDEDGCHGEYIEKSKVVKATIYMPTYGSYYLGYGLYSIPHELDHAIYGDYH
jgi:hypothetical protein